MKSNEFKEKMEEIIKSNMLPVYGFDNEAAHISADNLMCELLIQLGYEEGIQIFKDMPKWYS